MEVLNKVTIGPETHMSAVRIWTTNEVITCPSVTILVSTETI